MHRDDLAEKALTESIIGAFYETYNYLRFGYLESVYLAALERELRARNHEVVREKAVQVYYKGEPIAFQRLDMIVDGRVVLEVKATEVLPPSAKRQLLSYLRGTNLEVGLLLHFGPEAKFHRVVAFNAPRRNQPDQSDQSDQ